MQQGDVLLFQTENDGDINVENGIVELSGGLPVAAYLSLFGGNEDDSVEQNNALTWWGNLDEVQPVRQYRSETQNLLQAIPSTTGNLLRIEDAAKRDLAWMLSENVASSVEVTASMPGINRIQLDVNINAVGEESTFTFVENWKARS